MQKGSRNPGVHHKSTQKPTFNVEIGLLRHQDDNICISDFEDTSVLLVQVSLASWASCAMLGQVRFIVNKILTGFVLGESIMILQPKCHVPIHVVKSK